MGSFFNPSLLQIRLSLQVQMFKLDPEVRACITIMLP